MFWFRQGLCFLPVFLVVWSSSTFIISYLIAIFRHDVDIIFPYISDTGANPPESCIFGLMTFISACAGRNQSFPEMPVTFPLLQENESRVYGCWDAGGMFKVLKGEWIIGCVIGPFFFFCTHTGMATIYARYKFVEKQSGETGLVSPHLNKAALGLGLLSCLGMCVVATFQETTVTNVHDAGALLFFISGVLYIILQTVISHRAHPRGTSVFVFRARVGISTIAAVAFFPMVICVFFVKQSKLHRDKEDKDYPFHLASAVCEWVAAFSFICFFLTYIDDFKLFTLRVRTELEQ